MNDDDDDELGVKNYEEWRMRNDKMERREWIEKEDIVIILYSFKTSGASNLSFTLEMIFILFILKGRKEFLKVESNFSLNFILP